jgi:hypothetical protein
MFYITVWLVNINVNFLYDGSPANTLGVQVKVKVTLVQALRLCTGRTAHKGSRVIALLFHEGSASCPGRYLPPGKTRYALYKRLGGPQCRFEQVRKIWPPTGIRSPDRPVAIPTTLAGPHPGSALWQFSTTNNVVRYVTWYWAISMQFPLPKQSRLLLFHVEIAGSSINLVFSPKFCMYFYVFDSGFRDLLVISSLILLR